MPMQLRIGHLSTFYHTAMLLMADKGLCSGIDAEIEWQLFGTGPAIVNAFEKKEIDLAYIGLPPAIIGIERGVPIICIAGGHIEGTVICSKAQYSGYPEIGKLEDILKQFKGMAIGVPGKGSIHDVILQDSLEHAGLSASVTVLNFAWADLVLEALIKDKVAAAFGTPALAVSVKHYAGGKILYPPSKLWPNNPSYGIVVDKQFLADNPKLSEQFLIAHENAAALLRNEPSQAAEIIASHVGFIEPGFVLETLKVSPKYCAQLTERYIASTMCFVSVLNDLGYVRRRLEADEIFDRTLISKVHPETDHYDKGIRLY
ncbi:MAG: ABC transporter substrate-binding protein [Nitrospirae bacterium]|nr:ABC transporter substrate-binding protein [Nitrospirota bacterium]